MVLLMFSIVVEKRHVCNIMSRHQFYSKQLHFACYLAKIKHKQLPPSVDVQWLNLSSRVSFLLKTKILFCFCFCFFDEMCDKSQKCPRGTSNIILEAEFTYSFEALLNKNSQTRNGLSYAISRYVRS